MYKVVVLRRAERDAIDIFVWLLGRSIQGAHAWHDAFESAVDSLSIANC